jgi:hypothetical protein
MQTSDMIENLQCGEAISECAVDDIRMIDPANFLPTQARLAPSQLPRNIRQSYASGAQPGHSSQQQLVISEELPFLCSSQELLTRHSTQISSSRCSQSSGARSDDEFDNSSLPQKGARTTSTHHKDKPIVETEDEGNFTFV